MPQTTSKCGRLHHELIRSLVETCALPSRDELRARLGSTPEELDRTFDDLAEQHGVLLHPGSHEVWAIHPFSLAPTLFLVESGERKWWGNCAWCSLGIAVLVDAPCVITTTIGAEREQVRLTVEKGRVTPADFVVPVAKVLELATRWYGEHLRPDWTKKSVSEARAIFVGLGFTHPVWSLPAQEGRF